MAWTLLLASLALADELSHLYEANETVLVWLNKVEAQYSPARHSAFSAFPLCRGQFLPEPLHQLTFGETLQGFEMQNSGMEVRFLQGTKRKPLCSVHLADTDLSLLRKAVTAQYWMQFFVDGLAVWGPLGCRGSEVYTHFHLLIHYNEQQIVQVFSQPGDPVELGNSEQSLDFYYSVTWLSTATPFAARLSAYTNPGGFFKTYFFVFDTFMAFLIAAIQYVAIHVGVCNLIHKGYLPEPPPEEKILGSLENADAAFKQMAGEVFRPPSCLPLLTACVSAGTQLLAVVLSMLILVLRYPIYTEWGYIQPIALTLYSLFAFLAGLRGGSLYQQKSWIKSLLLSFFCVPFLTAVLLSMQSSTTWSWLSLKEGLSALLFAILMHVGGTVIGRRYFTDSKSPYKVNNLQPILRYQKRWLERPLSLIALTGLLPFTVLILATHYLPERIWDLKLYCIYGFALIAFLLILCTIACSAIGVSYYLITIEDSRWPWISFLGAGSTAGYWFLFAVYSYLCKSQLSGELPWRVFFCNISLGCVCFFLMFGTMGYLAASQILRIVYIYIKRL